MIPYTYQEMKKFICVNCGTEFESGSPQARYCTLACQRTAKNKRRHARDLQIKSGQTEHDERFYDSITDPSIVQLDKFAQLLLEGFIPKDKGVQFFGSVPYWTSPTGVVLAEQFGVEPRQWVMMRLDTIESLIP